MKKPLIILALLTIGSAAYAQVSAGGSGSATGSGSVNSPAASGSVSGNADTSGNGRFGGAEIKDREQAQAPDARMNNSNGINAQDRDKGLDRARDRMSPQGLEHNNAPDADKR
ncbi:MAG TPA: hypothetical protein VFB13_14105 [Reyranella sp.]|nr:hypothetical protein [Reyranella sp.]